MTANDIFSNISAKKIEGIMMHAQLADYFDFLGMMGFKRIHEYQFLEENAQLRGLHRYFINHFNMLLEESSVSSKSYIPSAWKGYYRKDVKQDAKKEAVKSCMETWVEWETQAKKELSTAYADLIDLREVAAAMKMKELLMDVDMELKRADRLLIRMASVDYDLPTICMMQDALHEEYREKEKGIGVNIC